ncbi:MAG TPA: MBL fold metallo-hydrolase [Rectinemataceae bacterium]|nr:MBL fold metallo-hydrolase [Rectinemataceae bacterium]
MGAELERIGEAVWIMPADRRTDRPILAAVVGRERCLLIDAGNSPAHAALFREALLARGIRLPDFLVLTHWHWDHSFGMSSWEAPAIACEDTALALEVLSKQSSWDDESIDGLIGAGLCSEGSKRDIRAEYGEDRSSIRIVLPTIRFTSKLSVDLGSLTCVIERVGGDHSPDSCFVLLREEGILFTGDALGPSVYGGPRSYTSENFLRLIRLASARDLKIIVESHGAPMSRDAFVADIEPWAALARSARRAGADRARLLEDLAREIGPGGVSEDLEQAADWFIAGLLPE